MRKIIVPVDFSENSWNALKCAIQYFKYEISTFYIVHAYADEVYQNTSSTSREVLDENKILVKNKVIAQFNTLQKRILDYSPIPKHDYIMMPRFGTLLDELNDIADQENADCIVMGTHGAGDNRSLTFGSQTLQILKYVKCPILAIPAQWEYTRPDSIVFPTDFMVPYNRRELKLLSCLSGSYRSKVQLLYVSEFEKLSLRQEDNKLLIEDSFRENEISYTALKEKKVTDGINSFIIKNNCNLLVMVNSRHSYMESFLVNSKIDAFSLTTKIPFLILQNLPRS